MERGYIRIFRKFFDGPLWKKKRVFSKAEAWIDLIQMARWKDTPEMLYDERGKYVLERGDLWGTLRFLGNRWLWSPEKVNRFCKALVKKESIFFKKRDTQRTIIHINKLDTYLEWGNADRTQKAKNETQTRRRRDADETKKKPVKKDNPVKPIKHKYGEYKHILLADKKYNELKEFHGEAKLGALIKILDEAIDSKGYKYIRFFSLLKSGWPVKEWEKQNGQGTSQNSNASGVRPEPGKYDHLV